MPYGARTADLTNLTYWLMDQHHGPVKAMMVAFNNEDFFFDEGEFARKIETKLDGGGGFIYPLRTSRHASWGSRGEGQTLPSPKVGEKQRLRGTMRFHSQQYDFEGLAQARSRLDKYAYEDAYTDAVVEIAQDFSAFCSDAMWRDGTGMISRINDATPQGAAAVVIDDDFTTGSGETWGTNHLYPFMDLAVWDGAVAKASLADVNNRDAGGEREIASVDSATQITLDSAFAGAVADNDWISWSVDRANAQVPAEMTGMLAHINNTGTVHNVNKANSTWFRSYVTGTAGAGTAFSLEDVDTHLRNIASRVGTKRFSREKTYLVCRPAMASRIWRETQDNTRYRSEDLGKQVGWSSFAFTRFKKRVEVIEAEHCGAGNLWYITPSSFGIHQSFAPKILDEDGQTIRNISRRYAFGLMYGWDCEAVCYNPLFNGVAKGYAE